jgi:hypothetical protein
VDPHALNVEQRWCVGQVSMDLSMDALYIRIARELVNRELQIVGNIFCQLLILDFIKAN